VLQVWADIVGMMDLKLGVTKKLSLRSGKQISGLLIGLPLLIQITRSHF